MLELMRDFLTPQQRRVIGEEAKQLLANKHLKEAFSAMEEHLLDRAKECDPDNKEKTQRVIIAMQIMEGIKREITRKIEDGEVAQIELAEIEARSKPLRFVRGY